jgi:molybdopterin molybdotransferase
MMISYEEALRQVLEGMTPVSSVSLSITECLGACLAAEVVSRVDLPGFDTASMDGYAVRSAELGGVEAPGGAGRGVVLPCGFVVAAGQAADQALAPGQCARILTGAPMPAGADAVVMQEDTEREPDGRVRFLEGARPWENVRFRGEDFRAGTRVLSAGRRLGPPQLALAAAAGHAVLTVHRPVRVAVLVSGDEVCPPGSPLGPGQIHDSNSVLLGSLFRAAGAEVVRLARLPDRMEDTVAGLGSAAAVADLVVTVGGASVGDRDLLRPAWERLGGRLGFFRVALKPGKPLFFGSLGEARLIGLPGNPVSALVTAVLVALPALRRLQGDVRCGCPSVPGLLSGPLSNPGDRRHFLRVIQDDSGEVRSAGVQASHILGPLAAANGLVDVPPATHWPAGTPVRVLRWPMG